MKVNKMISAILSTMEFSLRKNELMKKSVKLNGVNGNEALIVALLKDKNVVVISDCTDIRYKFEKEINPVSVQDLLETLQKFAETNPDAEVKLHGENGNNILYVYERSDPAEHIVLKDRDDFDMAFEINNEFEFAANACKDELDFFIDLLDQGFTMEDIRKYCPERYAYSYAFCFNHGLIDDKLVFAAKQMISNLEVVKQIQVVTAEEVCEEDKISSIRVTNEAGEEFVLEPGMIFELPDPEVSMKDMHDYGYDYDGMIPVSKATAESFLKDLTVYKLYSDGTEAAVDEEQELEDHNGLFGVELVDWFKSKRK